ncbi:hypothetical protein FV228_10775 [Methylobacterium sp. WL18]|uniref:hypothetical protein n=1 Tax=Methylobacterium sp. WL18 TaxID=2603897 RepID=UPI0011C9E3EE|nr:hypothetical protein [Methylobacterium sp. WL18]TXN71711.1 hypothetical protein FV228_10775 [Methylobacterium sp. WL18]
MSVFIVVSTRAPCEGLKRQIEVSIPEGKFHELNETAWMVDYEGTTRDLAQKLSITSGANSAAVVYLVSNYSGHASPFIWEWLKARPGTRSD